MPHMSSSAEAIAHLPALLIGERSQDRPATFTKFPTLTLRQKNSLLLYMLGLSTGEWQSLNDYDGNKANIVPDRAQKYWQAVRVSVDVNPSMGSYLVRISRPCQPNVPPLRVR
ncbi:unnamed protein product [Heligmosomoides polygyrus]|uniref:PTP_tm domain-containing protein n=1 Tax=Heligmosomoides polygyrus TaxID=6339 RepID=A0A183GI78_HELPZ|nr:unnamed protein product [Heligmosomoides polygyrus]